VSFARACTLEHTAIQGFDRASCARSKEERIFEHHFSALADARFVTGPVIQQYDTERPLQQHDYEAPAGIAAPYARCR
jgi:hypothetical protein